MEKPSYSLEEVIQALVTAGVVKHNTEPDPTTEPAATHNSPMRTKSGKLTMSVRELAQELGIGMNNAYALCHSEGFPAIQIGKRIVIHVGSLHEWLRAKGLEPKNHDAF